MNTLIFNVIILVLSFFFLIKGANYVLNGSISIAKRFKVSPLIIGSTIVAFGGVLPTIAVNLAILYLDRHSLDIAVGNMVGTNYVNLGLALGIPAFFTDIITKYNVFEKEIPLYLAFIGLLTAFAASGTISQTEGMIIFVFYLLITAIIYQYSKRERVTAKEVLAEDSKEKGLNDLFSVGFGLFILIFSSFMITYASPLIAKELNISNYVMGLTVVGIGTSIPTVVAGIQAARKGYIDIILGNVFGGNIINIGIGMGIPALFYVLPVGADALKDIYFTNIYNVIILLAILFEMKLLGGNKRLSRMSGALIILIYLGYLAYKLI
jgi:cation:H+ antiporter